MGIFTEQYRFQSLRFLDGAVEQLEILQSLFSEAMSVEHVDDFFSKSLKQFRVTGNV